VEDIVWGHLEKPFPMEIAHEANVPTGWIYLIKKMMERSPDDRFANYRELRTPSRMSTASVTKPCRWRRRRRPSRSPFRARPQHPDAPRPAGPNQVAMERQPGRPASSIQLSRAQVEDAMKNRASRSRSRLVNTLRICANPAPRTRRAGRSDGKSARPRSRRARPRQFHGQPQRKGERAENLSVPSTCWKPSAWNGPQPGADLFCPELRKPEIGQLRLDPALAPPNLRRSGDGFHLRRARPQAQRLRVRGRA
jgi:hypothetical protein